MYSFLISPRWIEFSRLPERLRRAVEAEEYTRIAKRRPYWRAQHLRRDTYALDVSWRIEDGRRVIGSVKVALVRDHPHRAEFGAKMEKLLSKSHRMGLMMAKNAAVSLAFYEELRNVNV
jgi:hypothetical protein